MRGQQLPPRRNQRPRFPTKQTLSPRHVRKSLPSGGPLGRGRAGHRAPRPHRGDAAKPSTFQPRLSSGAPGTVAGPPRRGTSQGGQRPGPPHAAQDPAEPSGRQPSPDGRSPPPPPPPRARSGAGGGPGFLPPPPPPRPPGRAGRRSARLGSAGGGRAEAAPGLQPAPARPGPPAPLTCPGPLPAPSEKFRGQRPDGTGTGSDCHPASPRSAAVTKIGSSRRQAAGGASAGAGTERPQRAGASRRSRGAAGRGQVRPRARGGPAGARGRHVLSGPLPRP